MLSSYVVIPIKTAARNELRSHGLQAWDQGRKGLLGEELSSPGPDRGRVPTAASGRRFGPPSLFDTGLSYNESQTHLSSACGTGQGGHELRVDRTGLDPIPLRRLTMLWGDCAEGQC